MRSGFPTLRDYKAGTEGKIYAYCDRNTCKHGAELNVDWLLAKFGPDFEVSAYSMNHRLKCSKCGGTGRINCPGDQRAQSQKGGTISPDSTLGR